MLYWAEDGPGAGAEAGHHGRAPVAVRAAHVRGCERLDLGEGRLPESVFGGGCQPPSSSRGQQAAL